MLAHRPFTPAVLKMIGFLFKVIFRHPGIGPVRLKPSDSQVHQHGGMNDHGAELADTLVQDKQEPFRQPSAEEVSRLTYGLRDLRTHTQEVARNNFAHLLNCGSSLE